MSKTLRGKDLSNEQFGNWKVLKFSSNEKSGAYYLCKCICGTEKEIYGYNLTTGKTKSCGCGKGENITGQKFNKLTVIKRTSQKTDYGRYLWECKCDCSNVIFVTSAHLKTGEYRSCGCATPLDIKGQFFGWLEVLNFSLEKTNNGRHLWVCKCHNCEAICLKNGKDLRSGKVISCGCVNSYGETLIKNILDINNIQYKTQVKFDDLIDERPLAFDFGIYKNNNLSYLIEFDGEQHNPNTGLKYFLNKISDKEIAYKKFNKMLQHDQMKNKYCLKNKIPLIRIPYKEIKHLTMKLLTLEDNPYIIDF